MFTNASGAPFADIVYCTKDTLVLFQTKGFNTGIITAALVLAELEKVALRLNEAIEQAGIRSTVMNTVFVVVSQVWLLWLGAQLSNQPNSGGGGGLRLRAKVIDGIASCHIFALCARGVRADEGEGGPEG